MQLGNVLTYKKGKAPTKIKSSDKLLVYLTPEYLRNKEAPTLIEDYPSKVEVEDGDLLLLWDGSNAGEFFKAKKGILSSTMVKLNFNERKYNKAFLYYQLKNIEGFLKTQTSGSGIPHVDKEVLSGIQVNEFCESEQKRIASILSKVDGFIELTEALMSKYQRVKTGLMQDLFTKGIDGNGIVRNESTHAFVEKNGIKVPEEWDVTIIDKAVKEILDFKANGSFETLTANVKYYYEPNYARLIRLTDLRNELETPGVYIDKKGFQFLKKTRLVEGDVLIACVGEYTGFVCQMPKVSYQSTIAPNMFVIRFKEEIDSYFISQYMAFNSFQNQISVVSTSSATKLLNNPNLRSLKIVVPPIKEQKTISAKLRCVDELIKIEKKYSVISLAVKGPSSNQPLMSLIYSNIFSLFL